MFVKGYYYYYIVIIIIQMSVSRFKYIYFILKQQSQAVLFHKRTTTFFEHSHWSRYCFAD